MPTCRRPTHAAASNAAVRLNSPNAPSSVRSPGFVSYAAACPVPPAIPADATGRFCRCDSQPPASSNSRVRGAKPYARNFPLSVRTPMPSASAVLARLPSKRRSVDTIVARSKSSNRVASAGGLALPPPPLLRPAPSAVCSQGRISAAAIDPSCLSTHARVMRFSNSRTFPGQWYSAKQRPRIRLQLTPGPPQASRRALEEMLGQQLHVSPALTQRRQLQRYHGESIVQVFAEPPRGDLGGQVAVRRGHHSHVDRARLARPHRLEGALLQHAQQLGLQRQVDLGNFVEQNRPALSQLKPTRAIGVGASERSAAVAEQLALGQLRRQGRAVEAHQRSARAGCRREWPAPPVPYRRRSRRRSAPFRPSAPPAGCAAAALASRGCRRSCRSRRRPPARTTAVAPSPGPRALRAARRRTAFRGSRTPPIASPRRPRRSWHGPSP